MTSAGGWAFERGGYTIALASKAGGEPIRETGKYITKLGRRSDGTWVIARDIWNSDAPASGPDIVIDLGDDPAARVGTWSLAMPAGAARMAALLPRPAAGR